MRGYWACELQELTIHLKLCAMAPQHYSLNVCESIWQVVSDSCRVAGSTHSSAVAIVWALAHFLPALSPVPFPTTLHFGQVLVCCCFSFCISSCFPSFQSQIILFYFATNFDFKLLKIGKMDASPIFPLSVTRLFFSVAPLRLNLMIYLMFFGIFLLFLFASEPAGSLLSQLCFPLCSLSFCSILWACRFCCFNFKLFFLFCTKLISQTGSRVSET